MIAIDSGVFYAAIGSVLTAIGAAIAVWIRSRAASGEYRERARADRCGRCSRGGLSIAAGTGGFVINGSVASDYSGVSVASAGDVNGDGLADLIVGAYAFNGSRGRSYVVFGKTGTAPIDSSAVAAGAVDAAGGAVTAGCGAPAVPHPAAAASRRAAAARRAICAEPLLGAIHVRSRDAMTTSPT